MKAGVVATAMWLAATGAAVVAAPRSATLLDSSTSWDGAPLSYPAGKARITAMKITLEEGDAVAFHCHPVPTFGYILEGSIRVLLASGREQVFHQGQALAEVVNTLHRGVAVGGRVEFVVFYAGVDGVELSLAADDRRCQGRPPDA